MIQIEKENWIFQFKHLLTMKLNSIWLDEIIICLEQRAHKLDASMKKRTEKCILMVHSLVLSRLVYNIFPLFYPTFTNSTSKFCVFSLLTYKEDDEKKKKKK